MAFTLFNIELAKTINKKIKLKSFNEKNFKVLHEANAYYTKIPYCYLKLSRKSTEIFKKQLRKDIKNADAQTFKVHLEEFKKDCHYFKLQEEYFQRQMFLNSAKWEQWKNKEQVNVARLLKLHKFWLKNNSTSHLSSAALSACAALILPVFENFLALANHELKFIDHKLPLNVKITFKLYLKHLADEIEKEKEKICDGMLSRLYIGAEAGELSFDDVTHYVIEEINKQNIIVQPLTEKRKGLNPDLFRIFCNYIANFGNKIQQKKLTKIFWLRNDDHFFSQKIDDSMVLIPSVMNKFNIPKKTQQTFKWLHGWSNHLADFFKERFYLLVSIRNLQHRRLFKQMDLLDLFHCRAWQDLNSLECSIHTQKNQALNFCASWINKTFFRQRCVFYAEWNRYLTNSLQSVLNQKIRYASLIAQQIHTRLLLDLDRELLLSDEVSTALSKIIHSVEDTINTCNVEVKEWQTIKETFIKANNLRCTSSADLIKKFDSIESSSVQQINSRPNEHVLLPQIDGVGADKEDATSLLSVVMNKIVKNDLFCIDANFDKQFSILENAILQETHQYTDKIFCSFWFTLSIAYLNTLLSNREELNLNKVLQLILKYAPPSLQERLIALQEKRCVQSHFIFQTRCKALLFSLKENKNLFSNNLLDLTHINLSVKGTL